MQNDYLIPANSKKSQYILGFFTKLDLAILIIGLLWSFIMLMAFHSLTLGLVILILLPGLVAAFLVMPVPHYHNILQLLTNVFNFYMNRRQYYWKGWNIYEEFNGSRK